MFPDNVSWLAYSLVSFEKAHINFCLFVFQCHSRCSFLGWFDSLTALGTHTFVSGQIGRLASFLSYFSGSKNVGKCVERSKRLYMYRSKQKKKEIYPQSWQTTEKNGLQAMIIGI